MRKVSVLCEMNKNCLIFQTNKRVGVKIKWLRLVNGQKVKAFSFTLYSSSHVPINLGLPLHSVASFDFHPFIEYKNVFNIKAALNSKSVSCDAITGNHVQISIHHSPQPQHTYS